MLRNDANDQQRSKTNNKQRCHNKANKLSNNGANQHQYKPPARLDVVNNRLPLCLLSPSNFAAAGLCRQLPLPLPVSVAGFCCPSPQSPPVSNADLITLPFCLCQNQK